MPIHGKKWKKGKVFRRGRRKVRWLYPYGKKAAKVLVYAGTWPAVPVFRKGKKAYRRYKRR